MKKKWASALCTSALVLSATAIVSAEEPATVDNWDSDRYGDTLDLTNYLRKQELKPNYLEEMKEKFKTENEALSPAAQPAPTRTVQGEVKYFPNINLKLKEFELRSVGQYAEVWVAKNLAYGPNNPRPADVITDEQVAKIQKEFDDKIYNTATGFFGSPTVQDGSNALIGQLTPLPADYYTGSDKIIILVDNVEDEGWDNPDYPFYTAGFFWQTMELITGRNIVTIDSWDWEKRLESSYYGTLIHEFQHLIQADNDQAEDTWLNEGFSTFSEYLGGYGHKTGHINYYLDHPENSLVNWDEHRLAETGPETLADYGQTYLFTLYLYDLFGQDFIRALATDGEAQGLDSVRKQLAAFGSDKTLEELYNDFLTALVVDSGTISQDYDIKSIDLRANPIDSKGTPRGTTVNFEKAKEFEKDGVPAWGGDFKSLDFNREVRGMRFNGTDFAPVSWSADGTSLVAPSASEQDANFVFEADLTNVSTATLSFDHLYKIEEDWDYGVVQVSTDNGETWTSLSNANTSSTLDPQGYPRIRENLPGFTGASNGLQTDEFDLSAYAGQKVHIAFRYLTDWGSEEAGWTVNEIRIPELNLSYNGSKIDQLKTIGELKGEYYEYQVTFIQTRKNGQQRIVQVDPFNVTHKEALNIQNILREGNVKMVTSFAGADKVLTPAAFEYEVLFKQNNPNKGKGNNNGKNKNEK